MDEPVISRHASRFAGVGVKAVVCYVGAEGATSRHSKKLPRSFRSYYAMATPVKKLKTKEEL